MKFIEICSKYKYVIAIVIFAFCFFFGENSILETRKLNKRISDLETELRIYKHSASGVKTHNSTLVNSVPEETEAYLRKHHSLKKENEDVFRVVPRKKGNNK